MKFNLQHWLRDYFGFSRRETNGFWVLSVLLVIILIAPLSYPFFNTLHKIQSKENQHLDSLLAALPQSERLPRQAVAKPDEVQQKNVQLSYFDPNTVSYEALLNLGFAPRVANNLIKYRSKGAKFYKASQIERIYGMDKAFFERISPYMQFPQRYASKDSPSSYKKNKYEADKFEEKNNKDKTNSQRRVYTSPRIEVFDLNQADANTLKQVRGIGEVLSARIVAYREKLGGFVSIVQLSEVYGLAPEAIEELKKYAQLSTNTAVRKLAINQLDVNSLAQHPYLDKRKAQTLVNYRTQHGKFKNLDALKNIKSLRPEFIGKLAPYLSFD